MREKEYVKKLSDEINFKLLIVFNHQMQNIFKQIENLLKQTSLFWEYVFDGSFTIQRLHQTAFKLAEGHLRFLENTYELARIHYDQ